MPPVITAVFAPAGQVLRDNRSCLLAQRANAAQPTKNCEEEGWTSMG